MAARKSSFDCQILQDNKRWDSLLSAFPCSDENNKKNKNITRSYPQKGGEWAVERSVLIHFYRLLNQTF